MQSPEEVSSRLSGSSPSNLVLLSLNDLSKVLVERDATLLKKVSDVEQLLEDLLETISSNEEVPGFQEEE